MPYTINDTETGFVATFPAFAKGKMRAPTMARKGNVDGVGNFQKIGFRALCCGVLQRKTARSIMRASNIVTELEIFSKRENNAVTCDFSGFAKGKMRAPTMARKGNVDGVGNFQRKFPTPIDKRGGFVYNL